MYVLPGFRAASAPDPFPSFPHRTLSSAGGSLTIVSRISDAAATSLGDVASVAPMATNSLAREVVRFHTVSANPALNKFIPIGWPIKPRPIRPTFGLEVAAESTEVSSTGGVSLINDANPIVQGSAQNAGTHLPST
jgi:hypothetical protein